MLRIGGPPLLRRHERLFYAKRIRRNAPVRITRQSIPPWVAFARRATMASVGESGRSCESPPAPVARLQRLRLAVPRRSGAAQRMDELPRGLRDLVDRALEGLCIGLRGPGEPADLPHELERGGADFVVGGGRLEVEQRADIAAHDRSLSNPEIGDHCVSSNCAVIVTVSLSSPASIGVGAAPALWAEANRPIGTRDAPGCSINDISRPIFAPAPPALA